MTVHNDQLTQILNGEAKLLFDGAMGTMLQAQGLQPGQLPDLLCIDDPNTITETHRAYVQAGASAITTNTFNANRATLEKAGAEASIEEIYTAAVTCARNAGANLVAGDIGPSGQMLDPYGDLEPEDAYEMFAEQARAAQTAGVDLILIETIPDVAEAEIAIKAAKENTSLPIFASMTFEANGYTLMGDSIESATERMEAAGADVVGINCSHGPDVLEGQIATMAQTATKPILAQPNAGMPELVNGQVVYRVSAEDFARHMQNILESGASIIGSCCGSTPAFTEELAKLL